MMDEVGIRFGAASPQINGPGNPTAPRTVAFEYAEQNR